MQPLWMMELPWQVVKVLTTLNENNYEAYVVGGCVRDAFLGKIAHDFDIATSATPDIVSQLFNTYKIIQIGVMHGTIAVIIDHMPIEITTYRTEGKYRDHRWPVEVSFTTSLIEDMKRRDFTMNALAYHPDFGIIDHFGGINDLQAKRVCAVGDPAMRFEEDALRILRCLRFASVLGFSIEEKTSKQVERKAHLLDVIAWERKSEELFKLLAGDHFDFVIDQYRQVISYVMPVLRQVPAEVIRKSLLEMKSVNPTYANLAVARFVVLLSSLTLPMEECSAISQELCLSNQLMKQISSVVFELNKLNYNNKQIPYKSQCKKWLRNLGLESIDLFFACIQARNLLPETEITTCRNEVATIMQNQEPYLIAHLAINGKDIQKLGIPAGPMIGQILECLLDEVIHDHLKNEPQELMNQISRIKDSQ